tara:strand:- start:2241 stop:2621 length:381 start_codon:yes stop_codon:yes gene_type:complete
MKSFTEYITESTREKIIKLVDGLQIALDVLGFDPTMGTFADGTNALISLLRAALAKEDDEKNRHKLNMAISLASMIPFADVIKFLKFSKPLKKFVIKLARKLKDMIKVAKGSKDYATVKKLHEEFY